MRGVYLNGPSKTAKGCNGEALQLELASRGYDVQRRVAGDFFRVMAGMVLDHCGVDTVSAIPEGNLTPAITKVVRRGDVFDHDGTGMDLQGKRIEGSVAEIAREAQWAGRIWFQNIADRARKANTDVLIVDARNPRERMAETGVPVQVMLDTYLVCEVREAARRTLLGKGLPADDAAVTLEAAELEARRQKDMNRDPKDNPFIPPAQTVPFVPGETSVEGVLDASWAVPLGEAPLPIEFDTTPFDQPTMLAATLELGVAAIERQVDLDPIL